MKIVIHYSIYKAFVTGALHPDGTPYSLKGLRERLQAQAKLDGHYRLTFYEWTPDDWDPGDLMFKIDDPYRRFG